MGSSSTVTCPGCGSLGQLARLCGECGTPLVGGRDRLLLDAGDIEGASQVATAALEHALRSDQVVSTGRYARTGATVLAVRVEDALRNVDRTVVGAG